jgi:hypothetical protein
MQVKVVNRNTHPYRESFDGRDIEIPAGGHILMAREDAISFLGRFSSIKRDVDGAPTPESYKRLEIVQLSDDEKKKLATPQGK